MASSICLVKNVCWLALCHIKELKNSLFTYYLLEALKGNERRSRDDNGCVTVSLLGKFVYDKMVDYCAELRSPIQKPIIIRPVNSADLVLAEYPQLAEVKLDRLVYWMESHYPDQQIIDERKSKAENREWKTIGVKVRIGELPLLNRRLARFNYDTLGDLVRGLIARKITQVTEDEQIEIMKTDLQTNRQLTGLSGKPYEFYKQIDITDFLKYLKERYSDRTAKSYVNYFDKYATIFFNTNPDACTPQKIMDPTSNKKTW